MGDSEQNKHVAAQLLQSMSNGDTETLYNLFAEGGFTQTMGNIPISGTYSRERIVELAESMHSAFPQGFRIFIRDMIAENDKVAVEAVSEGTHVSGIEYRNEYHFLFTLRDGKITSVKEYMDTDLARRVLCGGVS